MHGRAAAWDQIVQHADNMATVRVRFTVVQDASAAIARDDSAYGALCRWIREDFQARHVRQDELVDGVAENLRLIGESLYKLADAQAPAPDPVRLAAGPCLVAPTAARDAPSVGWAMRDVGPLRDVLDQLTGRSDVIASHAATWHNIAVELRSMAEDLEDHVEYDIPDWHGDEADEHRRLMGHNIKAIHGLSSISAALAEVTESVGVLVAQTRRIVRDVVIDLVAIAVPRPVPTTQKDGIRKDGTWQDGTFARWTCRIAVYAVALGTTLTHLGRRLNG